MSVAPTNIPDAEERQSYAEEGRVYHRTSTGTLDDDDEGSIIRERSFSAPKWLIIGVVLAVTALFVALFLWLKGREPDGPMLSSVVQEQQRTLDELTEQVNSLQQDRDTRYEAQDDLAGRVGELQQRIQQLERRPVDSHLEQLPQQVDALSERLDELSSSVDVRFNAALEKQQALEGSIEEVRKLRATTKPTAKRSSPPQRQHRPAPPSPPFTVVGHELRGGRRYLAVAAGGISSINDVRLIGEGESLGAWRLSSISGHSAVFSINGQAVVLPVP